MTAFGIDLGTTNSCIGRLVEGRPHAIPIAGHAIVPSVVLFSEQGEVVVGREARNLELHAPERCVRSVKRKMGREHAYEIAGTRYTPEQVSAEILRALKQGAEQATGEVVREVVITVPAYFDDAQRHATIRAGELAGLHVLRLLNEPTSASLVYDQVGSAAAAADVAQVVMIYDLGGGTFDVSVLEVFQGVREVRATAGDTQLGGDDFDELLFRHFLDHLRHEHGVDPRSDARAVARLRRLSESTKIELSRLTEAAVREEFLCKDDRGEPVHLELTVTRRDLEAMIRPLLDSTIELCRKAVNEARLDGEHIERICLVGGSTRIPLVRALLADAFEVDIHEEVDPDLAVAIGASLQAASLQGLPTERILVDVTAHSLGMRVCGLHDRPWDEPDTFAPIIRRNTVLPTERAEEFYTMVDDQESIKVQVFQGEHARASNNRQIGAFEYPLRKVPAGSPVRVMFAYDLDGIVRVSVAQPGMDNDKSVALALSDASAGEVASSAVERKARNLLSRLSGAEQVELESALQRFTAAAGGERDEVEEELLDLLLEIEDEDGRTSEG